MEKHFSIIIIHDKVPELNNKDIHDHFMVMTVNNKSFLCLHFVVGSRMQRVK